MKVIRTALCGMALFALLAAGCGEKDDTEKPDTPPLVTNGDADGGSDGGGVSCDPPLYCMGTDDNCYGPCSSGTCTLEPSGACSEPSAGGVYCCIPTGGISCTKTEYPVFENCSPVATCEACSIEACSECYTGGGCCTGYRTDGMQGFFPCGVHDMGVQPDCTEAAKEALEYCGCT